MSERHVCIEICISLCTLLSQSALFQLFLGDERAVGAADDAGKRIRNRFFKLTAGKVFFAVVFYTNTIRQGNAFRQTKSVYIKYLTQSAAGSLQYL